MTATLPAKRAVVSVDISFIDLMKLVFGHVDIEIVEQIAGCKLTVDDLDNPAKIRQLRAQCAHHLLSSRKVLRLAYDALYRYAPERPDDIATDWSVLEYELNNWLAVERKCRHVIVTPMDLETQDVTDTKKSNMDNTQSRSYSTAA